MSTPGRNPLAISIQPRDSGFALLGTLPGLSVIPESLSYSGDLGEYGCSEANWLMRIDPRCSGAALLEPFTPVIVQDGPESVWSGRMIATPTTYGEEAVVHCQAQGWGQHTKDDCIDKVWQSIDLSRWKDARTFPGAVLTKYRQKGNVQTDNQIMLAWPNGTVMETGDYVGVVFDSGPNNLITDWSIDWLSSNNWPASALFVIGNSITDVDGTGAVFNSLGASNVVNYPNTGGTFTGRFATPCRYIGLIYNANTAISIGADVYFKITGARVATTALSLGGPLASNIIKDTLTACCPLISTDQTRIAATSFAIPEFPAGTGWKYANELIDGANAFHGNQFRLSPDPVPVPEYRLIPTVPEWVVGPQDEYKFENPSMNDGRGVFSRVITEFADCSTVPGQSVQNTPSNAEYSPVPGVLANGTFNVDLSGWISAMVSGTVARTTTAGEVHSGAGAMKMTDGGMGDSEWSYAALTGLKIGRRYTVSMWSLHPVGFGHDAYCGVYWGISPWAPNRVAYLATTANGVYTQSTATFTATATTLWLILTDLGGGGSICYDDISISGARENIVQRRGFQRTSLRPMQSKSTQAGADAIAQLELNASQYPPLKGTLTVTGRIQRFGSGESVPVNRIPSRVGDALLVRDLPDPNTGAMGRQGIIMQATYDEATDATTIQLDSPEAFVEMVRNRVASAVAGIG